jgi:valyl-tRNA synthetase
LKGKKLTAYLWSRIPIIEDEYVDIEFGAGCLKVTWLTSGAMKNAQRH